MADRRALAGLLLTAGLLVGCTAGGGEDQDDATAEATTSPGDEGSTPTPSPDASDDATGGGGGTAAAPDGVPPTAEPVPLAATADFGTGVTSSLGGVEAIQAEAQGPGEIAGPALAFEIRLTNGSPGPVDLGAVTVNLTDDAGVPGLPMLGPPSAPFSGTLDAGDSVTGTYVFAVDEGSRSEVALEVSYSMQAPVVVFRGSPADV
ncbi:hypothetical protein ICW40_09005 [Actinotalea ferrariae]|uniref:hypothetical protein n=1 Tax=Actinotalea ferrariae TaxID=1386098 RepID=UPI001C8BEAD9|nr:hypothetical protein [Actinotalea ferrariae]MBX9244946.1 hypothetical protein [Actinotalea ferrariae]